MDFPEEEVSELKTIAPNLSIAPEGGSTYIYISGLVLPNGCQPEIVDALLCSVPREGYNSRLFFSEKITGGPERNWNSTIRVLGRNWFAISWQTQPGLRLAEILSIHLKALR
jgi:hypothetical protein